MKYRYLALLFASSFVSAEGLSIETLTFASTNKTAKSLANCEVLYEKINGVSEKSKSIKINALVTMMIEGSKENLKSNKLAEYNFGYEYQKNYWRGVYDVVVKTLPNNSTAFKQTYSKLNCSLYVK